MGGANLARAGKRGKMPYSYNYVVLSVCSLKNEVK
jgi:hypothetical protein